MWFCVVCLGFIGAGILIGKSYHEWKQSPIATSITTHPIDDLDFPVVTVCPPKDSNTALYHDLVKAGNGTLSDKERKILKESANEIFRTSTHKMYALEMLATSNIKNLDQVYQGYHTLPKPFKHENGFEMKMWNRNGTITTPRYGEDYVEEYYKKDRDIHMVLELPDDINDQVGSGHLVIEIEEDIREEEQIRMYSRHTNQKNWTEAEAECQREGGHLASVASEEENVMVDKVAEADRRVWLGGRMEAETLRWSDNSSWRYSNWREDKYRYGDCVVMSIPKEWYKDDCSSQFSFVCEVEHLSVKKNKTVVSLKYNKNQLSFTSFHVYYRYKAASKQMLDSWKNKRMTGLKLSWRIQNENPPLMAQISEVGRSIQTPSDSFVKPIDESSYLIYKAVLTIPEDLPARMEDGRLAIEIEVDNEKGPDGVVSAFWSYRLFRKNGNWTEGQKACKSEGGQLASIHSQWEQTLAERAAEGLRVWLGGWKEESGQWQWADNSTWSFTKWEKGREFTKYARYLQLLSNGEWHTAGSYSKDYSLCQGTTINLTEQGFLSVQLKKEQLKFFPLRVLFKSQRRLNSSDKERNMTGFTLNWFIKDKNGSQLTERLPPRLEDWNPEIPAPMYEQPLLADMVQLASRLRVEQNMTRDQILDKVIGFKLQNSIILEEGELCSLDQVKSSRINEMFSKLVEHADGKNMKEAMTDEDIETGFQIFHVIVYCPSAVSKLYRFIDHLLSSESARTIIQTIANLFHSGALQDRTSFIQAREFYLVLASTLQLQYGNVLLATSTKSQLQTMLDNDWPFFTNNTHLVEMCLNNSDCDGVQNIIQKLGFNLLVA